MFRRSFIYITAILTLALALATARPAAAQYMTGGDLSKSCDAGSPSGEIYRCLGYIAGVIDYHVVMQSLGTNPSTDFCLPPGTQMLLVTLEYPQEEMQGPPFSVPAEEVERLYGGYGEVRALGRNAILSREQHFADRGVTELSECAFFVTLDEAPG